MKEIIYNHTALAGRTITLTGLSEELGKDNILGIINKTTGKVLYTPLKYSKLTASYSSGTLTITLDNTITALAAGDNIFIKLYVTEDSSGGGLEVASASDYAAFKTYMQAQIATILTPLEDESESE